ncbi:family 78 glycoside hydrolase catalytic domain [Nonomuraea mangrovi]|uniref:alpha-L-rhamnosidase n=1 Tax=Nonomuraea mangrovi TaxID=2316207 RepID=A0ABW4T7E8_9ACTN
MRVSHIRAEHLDEPFGIGVPDPRLSWTTEVEGPWRQTAYEVEARGERVAVESDASVLVPWPFAPLASRERVTVRVRVRGGHGWSAWSDAQVVEAGLLSARDWSARFVAPGAGRDLLRCEFDARPGLTRARLYVTALGVYEVELNGERVGADVLAPGWTSYGHRLRYQTFDVTDLLAEGRNAIGAMLGEGWYKGRIGFAGGKAGYGDTVALLAQLELVHPGGEVERVVTGADWLAASGPITFSGIYDGEVHDAGRERDGWSKPGHDTEGWAPAELVERDLATLTAPTGPAVRRVETLAGERDGVIVDFGQNLVGRLRITAEGRAGERVVLRHAEVLENGELCTRPLRTAASVDTYTLRGGGQETWEPRFTFHGFRYASVEGPVTDVRAAVCHTDMARTGWFECSDPLLNRLHENVVWSMRGNFLDLPTDCPQRDERLGWTGDLQVFAPTAAFLYDCAGPLTSWLADLAAEQAEDGALPVVVPNALGPKAVFAAAGWCDAAVIVPWTLYERYGDAGILQTRFDSMRRWVDHVAALGEDYTNGYQFGDWLDPSAPPDRPGDGRTPKRLVAAAYHVRSADLVAMAADVLGRDAEQDRFATMAARAREAFVQEFVTEEGRILGDSATGYALAVRFGLLPTRGQRDRAGARLAALVEREGHRIPTGFLGTPLLCDALADTGHLDTAYRLLTQRECPSWLYPVTMGATTVWERWDSMLPDGSVNPGEMTSFNHYALGAVADWMHRTVAGLAPAAPGYRRLAVAPRPGGGLTWARARLRTPYGMAETGWSLDGGRLVVEAVVPPNTTALVTLPGRAPVEVGSGHHRW